LRPNMAFID